MNLDVISVMMAMILAPFSISAKAAMGSGAVYKSVFANVQALFGTGRIPNCWGSTPQDYLLFVWASELDVYIFSENAMGCKRVPDLSHHV